mmetsp:Transcript_3230/g.4214  ORF Transcript_3230/g.4214 Transcript_3230/m.4214 type:complete len:480 (+) Transcript_3230:160-1599(+)
MFKIGGGATKGAQQTQKKQSTQTWHTDFKFPACGPTGQFDEESDEDEDDAVERHLVALEGVVESILGQRRKMEDSCTVIDYLGQVCPELQKELEETMDCGRIFSFYGVFDGHAGHRASRLLKILFHENIFKNPLFRERKIEEGLHASFYDVDRLILEQGREGKWKDGACAVSAIVLDDYLYVANAGDSECVLGRRRRKRKHIVQAESNVYPTPEERDHPDWTNMAPFPTPGHDAIIVSKAHKTSDPEEQKRVLDAGGIISFGRMFGDLAVARAFGDSEYKMPLAAADYISVEPCIRQVPMDEYDEFIIMASDGIWDKLTAQEAVDMVSKYLEQKVRSGRPVAFAPPPPETPLAMDAVQTPYNSSLNPVTTAEEDEDSGDEKEEAPPPPPASKRLQMMKGMPLGGGGGGGGDGDDGGMKKLTRNKKTKFSNTSKLNQLPLEEIKSKKEHIASMLINEALDRGSKDNCTCVVVFFQWEEVN